MRRNAWKDFAKRQVTKGLSNCIRSPHHVLTTINSKKEELQTVGAFVKGVLSNPLEMLVHVTQWKARLSLVSTQTGTSSHETDKSL